MRVRAPHCDGEGGVAGWFFQPYSLMARSRSSAFPASNEGAWVVTGTWVAAGAARTGAGLSSAAARIGGAGVGAVAVAGVGAEVDAVSARGVSAIAW